MTASAQPGQSTTQRKRRREGAYGLLPERLPYATEFTDDPILCSPEWVVQEIQRYPDIVDQLLRDTDCSARAGRRRLPGKWALIMLAFTLSREVDVEPFCNRYSGSSIWRDAGFSEMPTPQTVWNRLTELEPCAQAFTDAVNKLVARALKKRPEIGRWVWADATASHTHARLEHCCPDTKKCEAAKGRRHPKQLRRASDELVTDQRHRESAAPIEDPGGGKPQNALQEVAPPKQQRSRKCKRPYRYFKVGEHLYRSLDPDAGARLYQLTGDGRKFWFGSLHQSTVSIYVGAPLAINVIPANASEVAGWPKLLDKTIAALGGTKPEAVVMDRAYSFKPVFKTNTELGIASVIPWRKWKADMHRSATDTAEYDRHGIPRCRYCGGAGDLEAPGLGWYTSGKKPRLRFRCKNQWTPDCSKLQSIACEKEWRLLVPMSRLTPTYHALSRAGRHSERVFRHLRDRYRIAGNNIDTRPKRPGLAWQNLRAQAALLVEWFRLCLRHGWIGSHSKQNQALPFKLDPGDRLRRVFSARRRWGIDVPYGPAAERILFAPSGSSPPPENEDDDALPF